MNDKQKTKTKPDDWPNTIRSRDELDKALEDGEKSGVSNRTIKQIFEEEIAKFKNE